MKKITTEEFIRKAKEIHGDKYDYSKTVYGKDNKTKVCIICPIHGEFKQKPNVHLNGHGCNECGKLKSAQFRAYTNEIFVSKARKVHGNKYDYSKVEYVSSDIPITIICPIHGEFSQVPKYHLQGEGCAKCYGNKIMITEEFIEKARKIHGDKYDYSKVDYKNNKTKVCIICPKHGEFWQKPNVHLNGHGCRICKTSKLERLIFDFLEENKIQFIYQAKKNDLKWLHNQSLDFYIQEHKIAIECQGKQHFIEDGWNNKDTLKINIERDERKRKLCEENGVKLLYYSNLNIEYPYEVITDKNKLLEIIKSYAKQKLD